MPRSELGNIIIGQASTLAMALQDFIISRYNQVRETQKEYLRRYGINAQVKKIDTASQKLSNHISIKYLQSHYLL